MPGRGLDHTYDPTIGERIRERRELLGMSVRGAALAANLSHSAWSRIERGERGANNRFVLARMAQALRCSVSDLTGERSVPNAREAAGISAAVTDSFRAVMTADPEYSSGISDAAPLDVLEERVAAIRRLRVACDYASALRLVPDTVRRLHAKLNGTEWREALRLLILAEEAVASMVRYQGTAAAMAMVTERMRDLSRMLGDPVIGSLAAFQRCHAASACGVYDYSRMVASSAIEGLSGQAEQPGGMEVLGSLMLASAFACYGDGVPGEAATYMDEAKRIAAATGDTMTLSLFFGPTNIQIWEISMETDGGDPARAVALARGTEPARVPHVGRQVTYHVDTGRALAYLGRDDDALMMLMTAERLAPTRVRADPLVWETARDVVERRKRKAVPPEVRAFCGRLGVAV
jgi:transcriptional regulator with XRE-family HTH domain